MGPMGPVGPMHDTIIHIAAFFNTSGSLSLTGATVTINAKVYVSITPNTMFSPLSGTSISLSPALNEAVSTGTISTGNLSGLSIAVTAQTRIMFVFSISATGLTLVNTVTGYTSGGIMMAF